MKRARTSSSNPSSSVDFSSARIRAPKRPKTIQACASCRKSKARCEILEAIKDSTPICCHRCKVLNNQCSYAEMDRSVFQAAIPPTPTPAVQSEQSSPPDASATISVLTQASGPTWDAYDTKTDTHPDSLWNFLDDGKFDWSAPLVAIQELAKQPYVGTVSLPPIPDQSLDQILPQDQILQLLDVFVSQYVPWLNFNLIHDAQSPVLDLVCCTVASRHLPPSTRSLVAPRLQKLTEDKTVKMIFNTRSSESLESIQALLILALWSPICGGENGRDGRLLIASAVSMAMNLRLGEASERILALRTSSRGLHLNPLTALSNDPEYIDVMNKARLWTALTNIESMLCLGSRRMPLSKRTSNDIFLIAMAPYAPSILPEGRDLRVRLMAELFNAVEHSRTIRLRPSEVDEWYDEISLVLASLSRLKRLSLPLAVVLDYDQFYFHMLTIVAETCRLVVTYIAMHDARQVFSRGSNDNLWFLQVKPHGLNVMTTWGKDVLQMAEAILVSILQADMHLLCTAPDAIFSMISFAAGIIVGVKFMMLNTIGLEVLGSTDALLAKTLDVLSKVSFSPDHSAKRCSELIAMMVSTWENRHTRNHPHTQGQAVESTSNSSSSSNYPSPETFTAPSASASRQPPQEPLQSPQMSFMSNVHPFSVPFGEELGGGGNAWQANPILGQDLDFWASFFGPTGQGNDHPDQVH